MSDLNAAERQALIERADVCICSCADVDLYRAEGWTWTDAEEGDSHALTVCTDADGSVRGGADS